MVFKLVRIGIPAVKLVASVRLNLAIAAFDNTGPRTGNLSTERLSIKRKESERLERILAEMNRLIELSAIKGLQFCVQAERSNTCLVNQGKSAPKPTNIFSNSGMTLVSMINDTPNATSTTMAG